MQSSLAVRIGGRRGAGPTRRRAGMEIRWKSRAGRRGGGGEGDSGLAAGSSRRNGAHGGRVREGARSSFPTFLFRTLARLFPERHCASFPAAPVVGVTVIASEAMRYSAAPDAPRTPPARPGRGGAEAAAYLAQACARLSPDPPFLFIALPRLCLRSLSRPLPLSPAASLSYLVLPSSSSPSLSRGFSISHSSLSPACSLRLPRSSPPFLFFSASFPHSFAPPPFRFLSHSLRLS